MKNNDLSEKDICTKFISVELVEVRWAHTQFRDEFRLTKERVMVWGKRADGNSKQKCREGLHQDLLFSTTP